MTSEEITEYMPQVPDWKVVTPEDGINRLQRAYRFNNFRQALDFTIQVGELAEAENHHPKITTEWGRVVVTWWTHAIKGLHQNDFIMASRTDDLYTRYSSAHPPSA